MLLIAAVALALAAANSAAGPTYQRVLDAHLGPLSVLQWINDALIYLVVAGGHPELAGVGPWAGRGAGSGG